MKKSAFTLIELLCVIAVIALLIALLMPSLDRAKQVATEVICRSRLHAFDVLGNFYLNEHDGFFPSEPEQWLYSVSSNTPEHPLGCRWHDRAMALGSEIMKTNPQFKGIMWEYMSDTDFGVCPTFRDYAASRGCENPDHNPDVPIKPQFSYSLNGYLGSTRQGSVLRRSQVRKPSRIFFWAEENSWTLRPDHPRYPARWLKAPLSTTALDDTVLLVTPTPEA